MEWFIEACDQGGNRVKWLQKEAKEKSLAASTKQCGPRPNFGIEQSCFQLRATLHGQMMLSWLPSEQSQLGGILRNCCTLHFSVLPL